MASHLERNKLYTHGRKIFKSLFHTHTHYIKLGPPSAHRPKTINQSVTNINF